MDSFKRFGQWLTVALRITLLPGIVPAQTTHDISLEPSGPGFAFNPSTLTIQQGDIVRWTNNSTGVIHTTTSGIACSPSGLWNSGNLFPSSAFSRQFNDAPGNYDYICIPHCLGGMTGLLIVENTATGIEGNVTPPDFRLLQNAPNPFSPRTTIEYELNRTARVEIRIYNLKGQLVTVVENEIRSPGRFPVVWNGRDSRGTLQATGVYFYQMSMDGVAVEMRKMVLLR